MQFHSAAIEHSNHIILFQTGGELLGDQVQLECDSGDISQQQVVPQHSYQLFRVQMKIKPELVDVKTEPNLDPTEDSSQTVPGDSYPVSNS